VAASAASGSAWKEDYTVVYGAFPKISASGLLQLTSSQVYEPRHARVEYAPSMIVDIVPASVAIESQSQGQGSFWRGIVSSLS
jgi:hypothetical protein